MLSFLFQKENKVLEKILLYLELFQKTQKSFSNAMFECFKSPRCEEFEFYIERTHKFESQADDVLDAIGDLMYGKALLPEARGDIMELMVGMDKIPNHFEKILHTIHNQNLALPSFLEDEFFHLLSLGLDSCDLVVKQVKALFRRSNDDIRQLASTIDENESRSDHLQNRLLRRLFDSDIEPFWKLQVKDLVYLVGGISDQTDRVSRKVHIIDIKRRV